LLLFYLFLVLCSVLTVCTRINDYNNLLKQKNINILLF
jgi:hypothetical protein